MATRAQPDGRRLLIHSCGEAGPFDKLRAGVI